MGEGAYGKIKLDLEIYTPNVIHKTRMTTFLKTQLKILYDQMNIDKYRLAANITEYFIISKLISQRIFIPKFIMIRQLYHVKISSGKKTIWLKLVNKQGNWALVVQTDI